MRYAREETGNVRLFSLEFALGSAWVSWESENSTKTLAAFMTFATVTAF